MIRLQRMVDDQFERYSGCRQQRIEVRPRQRIAQRREIEQHRLDLDRALLARDVLRQHAHRIRQH